MKPLTAKAFNLFYRTYQIRSEICGIAFVVSVVLV